MIDASLLDRVLGHVAAHTGVDSVFIAEIVDDSSVIRWAHGIDADRIGVRLEPAAVPVADVLAADGQVVIADAAADPRWAPRLGIQARARIAWRAYAGWPVTMGHGTPRYVFSLAAATTRTWDTATLTYASDVASLIAAALDEAARRAGLGAVVASEERARVARRELQRLAAAAVSASGVDDVARALVTGTGEIFGARLVLLALAGRTDVRIVHGPTVPLDVQRDWQTTTLDVEVPWVHALRDDASWIELADPEAIAEWPALVPDATRAGVRALVVVPLRPHAGAPPLASLSLGFEQPGRLDDSDRSLLAELAELASEALQRGRQLDQAREIADALQRSLLPPRIRRVEGLRIRAMYVPGTDIANVGGDWYDVVPLADGGVAFVVGDVAGHDIGAAAEMGQLRHVLASQLLEHGDGAVALANTDRYCHVLDEGAFATAVVIVLDPARERLRITSAGHLPPLLIGVDGEVSALDTKPGPPVGAGIGGYEATPIEFAPESTLVAYTDGLVERRYATLDECVVELASRLASLRTLEPAAIVRAIRDHLVAGDHADDAAALVVRRHADDTPPT